MERVSVDQDVKMMEIDRVAVEISQEGTDDGHRMETRAIDWVGLLSNCRVELTFSSRRRTGDRWGTGCRRGKGENTG